MRKRDIARDMAQESAIGCGTHFLLVVAGVAFLGGAAAYHGWVGKVMFIAAAFLVLLVAAAVRPSTRSKMGKNYPQK